MAKTTGADRSPVITAVLPDADARMQITTSLDDTMFVEAGAGSGKTSSLVDRIVNLVDDAGVPVARIAAITFTEAAARELRTRVRDAMLARGLKSAGDVESAAFTTLHGFALRLLSDHAIEAGLPPGFGVVDEISSALDFERDWRLFIGRIGDDLSLLELQERAAALDVKLGDFASVAKSFDDNWDLLERFESLASGELGDLSALDFSDLLARVRALGELNALCISDDDLLARAIRGLVQSVEALEGEDPLLVVQGLKILGFPRGRKGRKESWRGPGVDHVRAEVAALDAEVKQLIDDLRAEVISQITTLVAKHVLDRVADRQQAGQLSFHDLLVLARRLLRSDEPVRLGLHQRYTRILLDEFQDTDPIQIELAVLLAHPGPIDGRTWEELATTLPPGRLTVVGDPKQAIYRFRRADIMVYSRTEDVLVDESTKLVANFRSVPGIVEWVNDMFGVAIGDGVEGAQPPYTALKAVRPANPKIDVPVTVLGGPHDRSVGVGEIRELEAADVAAIACHIMDEEWPVQVEGTGGPGRSEQWRPARLADIAVLIPSRLSLPALESAFTAANVPFRPETSSLVYATQEVRDLVAGIRATVDPSNSIDVVACLRSNLFAVDDHELLAWKLAEQSWDYRKSWPEDLDGSPVADAFRCLRTWHDDRWWTEPSALVDRMIRERRLRELALAESRPRDRWRRYRFLVEQARLFAHSQGGDLQDFVDWVEIQSSDLARVTEPVPPEPDDDAVRVLTIHGAKGLEFPITVLAGAPSREGRRQSGPQVLFNPNGWPEVKLGKEKRTSGFDVRASVEEVLDVHERIRLHYVGATRARDHLIVSAHHKEGLRSLGTRTWETIQGRPELWKSFQRRGDEHYDVQPATQLRLAGGGFDSDLAEWQADQERVLTSAATGAEWSATSVAAAFASLRNGSVTREAVPDGATGGDDIPTPSGRLIGTVVHDVLQRVSLGSAVTVDQRRSEVDALARSWAAVATSDGDLAERLTLEAAARAKTAVSTAVFDLACRYRHWRELYVGIPSGGGMVEGFVDLCIDHPDGLIIVDYKTDAVTDDGINDFVTNYSPQLATYAVMLEAMTGRPVARACLLLLRPDAALELDVPDLRGAISEVKGLLTPAVVE